MSTPTKAENLATAESRGYKYAYELVETLSSGEDCDPAELLFNSLNHVVVLIMNDCAEEGAAMLSAFCRVVGPAVSDACVKLPLLEHVFKTSGLAHDMLAETINAQGGVK